MRFSPCGWVRRLGCVRSDSDDPPSYVPDADGPVDTVTEIIEVTPVIEEDEPCPVASVVCSVCGLLWDLHREMAERRLGYYDDDDEESPVLLDDDAVQLIDCVHLLLIANRGPAGPPGPPG
jgi:hypothetical protein